MCTESSTRGQIKKLFHVSHFNCHMLPVTGGYGRLAALLCRENAEACQNNRTFLTVEPEKLTIKNCKNNSCRFLGAGADIWFIFLKFIKQDIFFVCANCFYIINSFKKMLNFETKFCSKTVLDKWTRYSQGQVWTRTFICIFYFQNDDCRHIWLPPPIFFGPLQKKN